MKKRTLIITLVVAAAVAALIIWIMIKQYRIHMNKLYHKDENVQAFLKLIRWAEGTDLRSNPYAVTYGYDHTIENFADHPAITGEWTGNQLPDSYCKAVGLSTGCKSTAAGAYQFLKPTWEGLKSKLNLPDFSPKSQDLAAIELINEKGAIQDIVAGQIQTALKKVSKVWASIAGAGYGQPERSMTALLDKYNQIKLYA